MNSMLRDPELMRIAQEQMRRMSPEDMARIQQEMMSNPDLVKMATENMNNMSSQDIRNAAEQLNSSSTEDIVGIGEKMAKVKPEDIAAMRAQSNAYASYGLNAAQTLKQQGNELHGIGKFHDASQKYLHAKRNLKGVPMSNCRTLQLQCSLNLMSCYLKTKMFNECIKEGSEVHSSAIQEIVLSQIHDFLVLFP